MIETLRLHHCDLSSLSSILQNSSELYNYVIQLKWSQNHFAHWTHGLPDSDYKVAQFYLTFTVRITPNLKTLFYIRATSIYAKFGKCF